MKNSPFNLIADERTFRQCASCGRILPIADFKQAKNRRYNKVCHTCWEKQKASAAELRKLDQEQKPQQSEKEQIEQMKKRIDQLNTELTAVDSVLSNWPKEIKPRLQEISILQAKIEAIKTRNERKGCRCGDEYHVVSATNLNID